MSHPKIIAVGSLMLGATLACRAQSASTLRPLAAEATRHFRLTFTLDDPGAGQPQTYSLEVPVAAGKPGEASLHLTSGAQGEAQPGATETIDCTDVRITPSGLAAEVSITRQSQRTVPGMDEPVLQRFVFERKVDVALNTPTRISNERPVTPLGSPAQAETHPRPAPQITLVATPL